MLQLVPAPLLSFALSVLRNIFAVVPQKAVWTFAFDRRTAVTAELLEKAHTAKGERAVMLSTPASVKAFMLKLLELRGVLCVACGDAAMVDDLWGTDPPVLATGAFTAKGVRPHETVLLRLSLVK